MDKTINDELKKTVFANFNSAAYDFYFGTFTFVFILSVLFNDACNYVYTGSVVDEWNTDAKTRMGGGKRSTRRKASPSDTLSTTKSTWTESRTLW
jgi:hypothetical protein